MTFTSIAIGVIHSPFPDKESAPIQGAFVPERVGRVEVFEHYAQGLSDIEE